MTNYQPHDTTATPNLFPDLIELDALRLTVIVDNEVDNMTSVPKDLGQTTIQQKLFKDRRNLDKERSTAPYGNCHSHATKEGEAAAAGGGVTTVNFDFNDVCCGAHGLSILLTGIKDNKEHKVLFDTGPTSAIFLENAKRLEIEFEKIEVIVLSHWHMDHSGGMLAAVEHCQKARLQQQQQQQQESSVVIDLHPDRPDERGTCLTKPSPAGATTLEQPPIEYVAWGKEPAFKDLESAGGKTGVPNHVRWSDATKTWSPEPEIMDERYVVARVKSKGLV
ncbi:hypothetical protein BGX24_005865, partial [Mortierella sp. AD032]